MHNNYFFLRQLSTRLDEQLTGFRIGEIYSQQRNELTISLFDTQKVFYIKAHLDSEFSCLYFPDSVTRARKNSVDLFKEIVDLKILKVVQIENDRSFYFQLDRDFKLLFKLHGNRSNIVLLKDGVVLEIFRNKLKHDIAITLESLSKSIDTTYEGFKTYDGNYRQLVPTIGKAFDDYFKQKDYDQLHDIDQYEVLMELLHELEQPKYYIQKKTNEKPKLLLHSNGGEESVYKDPVVALNKLFKAYISDYSLERGKFKKRNILLHQIRRSESYIKKVETKLKKLKGEQNYSHLGDLIMANLHNIKAHQPKVTLHNFYDDTLIEIKLKPSLSPQLNAEKYYKKAKSQKIELDRLQQNIELKKEQIKNFQGEIRYLEQINSLRELRKGEKMMASEPEKPFHLVNFMDYEILVGKNARKNESLTFGLARKDDLFLHAKDGPGSHVIIRGKKKQNFPITVIEKAASIAAYYSKSKNESLVRVLYTPKKYVRKAKNSPPGTAIIVKEKIILVPPTPLKK